MCRAYPRHGYDRGGTRQREGGDLGGCQEHVELIFNAGLPVGYFARLLQACFRRVGS